MQAAGQHCATQGQVRARAVVSFVPLSPWAAIQCYAMFVMYSMLVLTGRCGHDADSQGLHQLCHKQSLLTLPYEQLHACQVVLLMYRLTHPLGDKEVLQIGSLFGITGLLQHVAKTRRQLKQHNPVNTPVSQVK